MIYDLVIRGGTGPPMTPELASWITSTIRFS